MFKNAQITFLGTGTSIGVPVIGCDCEVCTSQDSKNQRLRSSIYVKTHETEFIVDTGPDFRQQCLRAGIRNLDAALFTHAHSDHVMGFDDLRRYTVWDEDELEIYATGECMNRLEGAFPYIFDGMNKYRGYLKIAPQIIEGAFEVGDLLVHPLPVTHGKVETIGFLFEKAGERLFAYIPDAKELSEKTKTLIRGIDLLILDGLQPELHWTHLSIGEAIDLAEELQIGQTWLTHFSCRANYAALEPGFPEGVRMAWDELQLEV